MLQNKFVGNRLGQRSGINFNNTSVQLVSIAALCLTLAVVGSHMTLKHLHITTTFPESKVNNDLYVTLRKGVVLHERDLRVGSGCQTNVRLLKRLYGLKQDSLNWFETVKNVLCLLDFRN